MTHDFKKFPELTNSQMEIYYFESPHKQITEDFRATVVKVTDGDTIRVETDFRDFDFPVRLAFIQAPEIGEVGFIDSQRFLSERILGKEVEILVNPKVRVGKWGRLIGDVIEGGLSLSDESMDKGHSVDFSTQDESKIPLLEEMFNGT